VAERRPYAIVHRLLMADGRIKFVQEHGETDYDGSGRPIRSRGTVQDVTVRRLAELQMETSLREKETLLREVHHRVKNNLQIISSLLYFQSKKIRDPEDLLAFREGQDRLKSMILVHEKLYRSDDLMRIEFGDYARALIENIRQSYRPVSARVEVVTEMPLVVVPVEIALPAGMIVNELLTNVFKYAFPEERGGIVRIAVTRLDGGIEVLVGDSGVGLPAGLDPHRPTTFGFQLVHGLASQLGGRVSFERQGGTIVRVYVPFPVPA
jgi:two-component sensor histidine kinase